MNLRSVFRPFSSDLAIDLGTANTLVYRPGMGIVLNEPSVVAVQRNTGKVVGCGSDACEMLGRTPGNIVAIRPMRDGVIADFKMAEHMLNHFITKAHKRRTLLHPRIVISIPSEITEVERRAVIDSSYRAKASEVRLVEQPLVAALGAGMPVTEPKGNMIVDIGGGTTDIAIISLSGIVYSRSLRIGGYRMDEAIIDYARRRFGLLIGERTAERAKIEIGSAYPLPRSLSFPLKGRDLTLGLPRTVLMHDEDICVALVEPLNAIVASILLALEHAPPELGGDIFERGIILTGGGSMLRALDERIHAGTGVPVLRAEQPLASAVLGTGKMLEDYNLLKRVCLN